MALLLVFAVGCGKKESADVSGPVQPTGTQPTAPLAKPPAPEKTDPLTEAKARSRASLKAIATAFERYEEANGYYPVGLLDPKTGRIGLSWRVQILPHLGDPAAAELYKQFKLDEPWDSERNKPLVAKIPAVFAPARGAMPAGQTYYQGFADHFLDMGGAEFPPRRLPPIAWDSWSSTAFFPDPRIQHPVPPGESPLGLPIPGRKADRIVDGTDNTFLVAEAGEAVPWTSPQDISFQFIWADAFDVKKGADLTGKWPALGGVFDGDFHAVSVSGNALVFVQKTAPVEKLRPFITTGGGTESDFEGLGLQRPR